MITTTQWYAQYTNKRKLFWALLADAPLFRLRQLMDAIPYDP